jgi:hypothetical protein
LVDTGYPVIIEITDESNGVNTTADASGNLTQITFDNSGVYDIQFSFQVHKTGGGGSGEIIDIWFRKNGIDIPDSNTRVTVNSNNPFTVPAWNFMASYVAGDYVQIMWATDNLSIIMETVPAFGIYPRVPSTIVTVAKVMNTQYGPTGYTGPSGPFGYTGITGSTGYTGAAGEFTSTVTFSQGTNIVGTGADITDYNLPSGTIFVLTGTGGYTFQSCAGGVIGRYVIFINNTTANIPFKNEGTGTDVNRFSVATASSLTVDVNSTISFIYSTIILGGVSVNRWVCLAKV